jgi:hypothetical protein
MNIDLVLDTHVLVEVLYQYYEHDIGVDGQFKEDSFITKEIAFKLNQINNRYLSEEDFQFGMVVTSIFSFVEIVRQFEKISAGKFSTWQFKAFIAQTPPWFLITSLSIDLCEHFYHVPRVVLVNNEVKPIEWPDAVQCATYLSRQNAYLATADTRIREITSFNFL